MRGGRGPRGSGGWRTVRTVVPGVLWVNCCRQVGADHGNRCRTFRRPCWSRAEHQDSRLPNSTVGARSVMLPRMSGRYNKASHEVLISVVKALCHRSSWLAKSFELAGHVASYANWQAARGLDTGSRYATRAQLWRAASGLLQTGKVTVLEFGVAAGDATRTWLSLLPNPELSWHGFDTFTGLPTPWIRGDFTVAEAGTFDA